MGKWKCTICGTEFESTRRRILCPGSACKSELLKRRLGEKLKKNSEILASTKIEGEDYVKCKWCNNNVTRIYGTHIKSYHPGKTTKDYLDEFPGSKLAARSDNSKVAQGFVRFVKSEEGKKFFSEQIKGQKNPNAKINATEEERKSRSPFSRSFYEKKGMTDEEIDIAIKHFTKEAFKDRLSPMQIDYWMEKTDGNIEESRRLLKERQTTFSLEKCILKYGENKGMQIWKERQEKWFRNYKKTNFSKVSQQLFLALYELLTDKKVYFAYCKNGIIDMSGINNEFTLVLHNRTIKPDFFMPSSGKIIEFDGVYYHRNTSENKAYEKLRDESIIKSGYTVMHVSEAEWKKTPDKVIEVCLKFLNANEKNSSQNN